MLSNKRIAQKKHRHKRRRRYLAALHLYEGEQILMGGKKALTVRAHRAMRKLSINRKHHKLKLRGEVS